MMQRRKRTAAGVAALVAAATVWWAGSGGGDHRLIDPPTQPEAFLAYTAPSAQENQDEYGVPASVALAQAILESNWAQSELTVEGLNFFGIKCNGDSPYATGCLDKVTSECTPDGACSEVVASFRTYATPEDSFRDHGRFLTVNPRYADAFNYSDDPDRFAQEIAEAGYATDPEYANKLIKLMQDYNLYQYNT